VFRALYRWRHELCTELNRAAVHIFPNDAMAEVARMLAVPDEDLIVEPDSIDTAGQAQLIQSMVSNKRPILVTSASHMPPSRVASRVRPGTSASSMILAWPDNVCSGLIRKVSIVSPIQNTTSACSRPRASDGRRL
jgi:ribonuclease D